jgi:uncharacterized SAM-binding protein YcdF (DUF218 family)
MLSWLVSWAITLSSFLVPSPLLALLLLCVVTVLAYRQRQATLLRRMRHGLLAFTVWIWACCTPALTNQVMVYLEGPAPVPGRLVAPQPRQDNTSIIVLGSGDLYVGDTVVPRLDENGWERLYAGVQLWKQTGGRLIFTGGPGGPETITLAGHMADIAHTMGVPRENLATAVNSLNTYQDMVSAQKLLLPGSPVWVVTSAAHMPRTLAVARKLGIMNLQPYPVDYRQIYELSPSSWTPNPGAIGQVLYASHEIIGRLHYMRKGWAD